MANHRSMNLKTWMRGLLAAALTVLSGCGQAPPQGSETVPETTNLGNNLEPIYGFQANSDYFVFWVRSTGCTQAGHFDLALDGSVPGYFLVRLSRNTPDRCRAMPRVIQVQLALDESVNPASLITVKNPFAVNRKQ